MTNPKEIKPDVINVRYVIEVELDGERFSRYQSDLLIEHLRTVRGVLFVKLRIEGEKSNDN